MKLNIQIKSQILAIFDSSIFPILQSIATICIVSVACYQEKYEVNLKLSDQSLHN